MTHRISRIALVFSLVVVLTACGGTEKDTGNDAAQSPETGESITPETPSAATESDTTERAPTDPTDSEHPCDWVTQEEASTLTGVLVEPGEEVGNGQDARCTFTALPTGPVAQVEVFFGPGALKHLEINRELGAEPTPIDGLGDEAYLDDFTLFFRVSDTWYGLHMVRLDEPAAYAAPLEHLARTILERVS